MVSSLLMVLSIFGATWLVSQSTVQQMHALAPILMDNHKTLDLQNLLVTITTVNQEIQGVALVEATYTKTTSSGMASSVKEPAALVPTLPHGSVYSFLLQQLIQYMYTFVVIKVLMMKTSQLNWLKYMCSNSSNMHFQYIYCFNRNTKAIYFYSQTTLLLVCSYYLTSIYIHVYCNTRVTYTQLMPRRCTHWGVMACAVGAVSMNKAWDQR